MTFFNNLSIFFNKSDFDFEQPYIGLHTFHRQLRVTLSFYGMFSNNRDSPLRFLCPVTFTTLVLIASAFQLMFIYHGIDIKDYAFATECMCYLVIVALIPFVSVSMVFNRDGLDMLLEMMEGHYKIICNETTRYRTPFLKGQLYIWKMFLTWFGFLFFVSFTYIGNTLCLLFYQNTFTTQDENYIRPLIFPMWLPEDDPYRTPNYEIFLAIQIIVIFMVLQIFGGYIYMIFHFLLHNYYLMDMIILDFEVLFENVDPTITELPRDHPDRIRVQGILNTKMKRIVTWHNDVFRSMTTLSSMYGPPLVYQVLFSSVAICAMAYQIVIQFENGKFDFLFFILWVGACLQLWIPCYLGTLVRDKAFEVGEGCWNSGWHQTSLGIMLRPDIILVILRAQQPLSIKFTGLPELTLETYSSIMSTSYSYFNMLRQSTK